jgi:hypothetical protein
MDNNKDKDDLFIERSQEFSSKISNAKYNNIKSPKNTFMNTSNTNDLSLDIQFNQIVNMKQLNGGRKASVDESEKRSIISE